MSTYLKAFQPEAGIVDTGPKSPVVSLSIHFALTEGVTYRNYQCARKATRG